MIAVLVILGLVAAGLILGLVATSRAPFGYQDETGFHYGPERTKAAPEFSGKVPEPKLA